MILGAFSSFPAQAGALQCEILTEIEDRGMPALIRVSGIVESPEPVAGRYTLQLDKIDPAGRSRSMQAGEFTIAPGQQSVEVVQTMVSLAPSGRYDIVMDVQTADGRATCTKSFPEEGEVLDL